MKLSKKVIEPTKMPPPHRVMISKNVVLFTVLSVFTVMLLSYLVFHYVGPFGKVVDYSFVQKLSSAEPISSLNTTDKSLELGSVILKTKTTRFSLPNLKKLSNIKFRMAYKPGQAEIKVGVRGDEANPFVYRSLFFKPLSSLSWDKVEENGMVLYQKKKEFASVTEFLTHLPVDKKIGSYQLDPHQLIPLIYPKETNSSNTVIATPIRGSATAYILSRGGDLTVKITKQDMNMYDGADALNISLTLAGVKVQETTIADDGFADKSKSQTAPQTATINVPNAKPGVYKLEMKFDSQNGDSFISKIEVNQKKIIFDASLLTWGGVPTTVYMTAPKLGATTSWPEFVQTLKLDDKVELPVKTIKTKFEFDLAKLSPIKGENNLYKITIPKGNVSLLSPGYLAFAKESYFDPQIIKTQALTTFDTPEGIAANLDFVLTTVQPTTEENGSIVSEVSVNPADYALTGDKIFFSLEIPEIDKHGGTFEISGLHVTLLSQ